VSDTPLSDVMAEHSGTRSPESYERFLGLFRASVIGIVSVGAVRQDARGLQLLPATTAAYVRQPMVTDGHGCLPTPIPKRPCATSVPDSTRA
jgi:hypothetical protein